MDKIKRVLVLMVTETGDEVSVSVRTNKDLTVSDKKKLKNEVTKKIIPYSEDALYFRIRYNEKQGKMKGIVESIKVSSSEKLDSEIDAIFAKLGVVDEI